MWGPVNIPPEFLTAEPQRCSQSSSNFNYSMGFKDFPLKVATRKCCQQDCSNAEQGLKIKLFNEMKIPLQSSGFALQHPENGDVCYSTSLNPGSLSL